MLEIHDQFSNHFAMGVKSSRKVMPLHSVLLWRRPRETCLPFSVPVPCTITFFFQTGTFQLMKEICEFPITHTECVFGNMLHRSIPARQPSLQLLCTHSQSSTEEVICVVGNRAGLSTPMSGFPYVSGEASPACEWDCNGTYSRANRSFCPSITALRPWDDPYVPCC